MFKINIEHEDTVAAAVVAGIIENALAQHGFSNVKGKCVMVYQQITHDVGGAVAANFSKRTAVKNLIDPEVLEQPKRFDTVLIEARYAFGYPEILEWAKADRPGIFTQPILIDAGLEPKPYEEQLKAFKEGTGRG